MPTDGEAVPRIKLLCESGCYYPKHLRHLTHPPCVQVATAAASMTV